MPERVVVDDLRTHKLGGVHLRSSHQAILYLADFAIQTQLLDKDDRIEELFLDHDLGGDDTIRPVVVWLEEMIHQGTPLELSVIYAHTANPVGADYIMKSRLLNLHYTVRRINLEAFK